VPIIEDETIVGESRTAVSSVTEGQSVRRAEARFDFDSQNPVKIARPGLDRVVHRLNGGIKGLRILGVDNGDAHRFFGGEDIGDNAAADKDQAARFDLGVIQFHRFSSFRFTWMRRGTCRTTS